MKKEHKIIVGLAVLSSIVAVCPMYSPYKDFERMNLGDNSLIESIELPANFQSVPSDQENFAGSVAFGRENSQDKVIIEKGVKFEGQLPKAQDVDIDGRTTKVDKWFGDRFTGAIRVPSFEGSTDYHLRVSLPDNSDYFIAITFIGCEKLDCDRVVKSIKWKKTEY